MKITNIKKLFSLVSLVFISFYSSFTSAETCSIQRSSAPITWNQGDNIQDMQYSSFNAESCSVPANSVISGATITFNAVVGNTEVLTNGLPWGDYTLMVSSANASDQHDATVNGQMPQSIGSSKTSSAFNGYDLGSSSFNVSAVVNNSSSLSCSDPTPSNCNSYLYFNYTISFEYDAPAPAPTASVNWSPSTVEYGGTSTVSWSSTDATSCTLAGVSNSTSGSWVGTNRIKNQTTPLYCEGPGGTSNTVYATLTVNPPPVPTASVSWSPSTVEYGGTSTVSWSSTGATSCTLSGSSNSTSGSWIGTNRIQNQTTPLYCEGPGGTSSTVYATLTVDPIPPVPTVSISWSPSTVEYGGSSTVSWSSTNATSCKISGSTTSTSGSWVGTNRTKNQTTPFYCEGPGGTSETVYATLYVTSN